MVSQWSKGKLRGRGSTSKSELSQQRSISYTLISKRTLHTPGTTFIGICISSHYEVNRSCIALCGLHFLPLLVFRPQKPEEKTTKKETKGRRAPLQRMSTSRKPVTYIISSFTDKREIKKQKKSSSFTEKRNALEEVSLVSYS